MIDHNVEQINLMCIFNHSDRMTLIEDMKESLPYIDDAEMSALMEETIASLEVMSDEEFSEIIFEPAMDEEESWEDEL